MVLTILTVAMVLAQLIIPSYIGIILLIVQLIAPDSIPIVDEALSLSILLTRLYFNRKNTEKEGD